MGTFKCQACGNLHGAPVEKCGMCGSPSVVAVDDQGNAFAGSFQAEAPKGNPFAGAFPPDPERKGEVADAWLDFLRAGSAFFRQNTPTVREPSSDRIVVD